MRKLKRLLLTGAMTGLIGTFGLAANVFAAGSIISAGQDGTDSIKVTYSTDEAGKLTLKLNGVQIDEKTVEAGTEKIETFSGIKNAVNSNLTKFSGNTIDGFSVELTGAEAYNGQLSNPLNKLAVIPGSNGTTYLDGSQVSVTKVIYDYATGTHSLNAEGNSGYDFYAWKKTTAGGSTDYLVEPSQNSIHADGASYESVFYEETPELESFDLQAWTSSDSTRKTSSISVKRGDTLYVTMANKSPADGAYETLSSEWKGLENFKWEKSGESGSGKISDTDAGGTITVTAIRSDGVEISRSITVSINADYEATTIKLDEDQLEYITQGYTLEVKGTITGTNRDKSTVKFEKFKGEGAKIKDVEIEKGTDKSTFRFKIDTEDCSVSSGETLEVKVKVTVAKGKSETEDLVKEEFFVAKVYPKSTLSYASDTRKFSYTAPTSVNTGTESGKGDNDKDNQLTNFTGCKGVLIKVWKGDVSGDPLWTSTSAVTGGNSASINAESLVTALTNDKKLSESGDFKFRVYPCNSSNKYNKNVYSEYSIHIYKINVAGTGVTAQSYYGLSGQEIEIKAVPIDPAMTWTADSYWMDDATKKEGQTRKVKVTEDKTYTAVLGTKTSDDSASSRAGVNKWGQNNVGVYLAVVLVIGAVCLGLHLYDRKKKNI